MFRDTITCPHCREHFTSMLASYRTSFPNMLGSRQEFAMFTFRAHNAVNRRLRKPLLTTLEECMTALQTNVKLRSASDYRTSYLNHITKYWKTWQDVTGIVALKKINEMRKIEVTYLQSRDSNFNVSLLSDVVVLPRDALAEPTQQQEAPRPVVFPGGTGPMLRLTSTGFRIRR